jgi:hypothetical protein
MAQVVTTFHEEGAERITMPKRGGELGFSKFQQ